jgi:hypothetical protein
LVPQTERLEKGWTLAVGRTFWATVAASDHASALRPHMRRIGVLALFGALALAVGLFHGAAEAGVEQSFGAVADTYSSSYSPTSPHGDKTYIHVDSGDRQGYVRFSVSGLTGSVTRATLRLYPLTSHPTGFEVRPLDDNSWSEDTLTWGNAPAPGSAVTASSGAIAANSWVSLDVTPLVTGNGTFSFALTTSSSELKLASKEDASNLGPELIVETADGSDESTSAYRSVVLDDAPRGYWRLDETSGTAAADEAPAGNKGTYKGGVSLGAGGALLEESNRAVWLDGVDELVDFGDPANGSLDMGTGDFSVEAWIKTSVHGEQAVISKKGSSGPNWLVTVTDDSGQVGRVRAYIKDASTSRTAYGPSIRVDDGKWHHVVVLFDRDTGVRIYVDGASSLKTGAVTGTVANSGALKVGAASSYKYFSGRIDEVAIYRRLLSQARIEAHIAQAQAPPPAGDDSPPSVTLTSPQHGSTTTDGTPTFSGTAGTAVGDESSVTVDVYSGGGVSGSPVQTLTAVPDGSGAWSVEGGWALAGGTYTARATQMDAAGNQGESSANSFTVSVPIVAAAGDIACDPADGDFNGGSGTSTDCRQQLTADLVAGVNADAVLPLGDIQYECAGAAALNQSYDPSWGRFKPITWPVPGNHEYQTSGGTECDSTGKATAYFDYFGARAGERGKGYYSFDIGAWHVVVLNSMCSKVGGCEPGSAQEQWLRADLAAHQADCTLALFHHPLFSSGSGELSSTSSFWQALYDGGADVVLNGHDHLYERFAPQAPNGQADPARGIRQFTVGTGGHSLFGFSPTLAANSQAVGKLYGILKLALHPTGYDWTFVPEPGKTFSDSGSSSCH